MTSCHSKHPPLLQMYTAPSGPMAAPFGPPPHSAMTSTAPFSTSTRLSVPRLISTRTTLPSSIAIGPSGNCNPLTISRNSGMRGCLAPSAVRQCLFELFGGHEDVAGLRTRGRADDAALLEEVHEPAGPGEADPQLALQHGRGAQLRPHDELHRLVQQVVIVVVA